MDGAALLQHVISERFAGSQAAFARAVQLPRAQISLYVGRHRTPGRENSLAIEQATNGAVPVESWSGGKGKRKRKKRAA